jgi:hypothetical protein
LGGQGNDSVVARVGFADVNGDFAVDVDGGGGADAVDVVIENSSVALDGSVKLNVLGGGGNDRMAGRLRLGPESQGAIDLLFQGDGGNDFLMLVLSPEYFRPGRSAMLDGGAGFDVAIAPSGARVVNCERVVVTDAPG